MANITRVNGTTFPGTFHGGYQLRWYKIAGAGLFTDTAGTSYSVATNVAGPESKFEKAIRAIETVATVVVVGVPTSAGVIVGIDGATWNGRGDSTGYAETTTTQKDEIDGLVEAATGLTVTTTEVVISGVTFTDL